MPEIISNVEKLKQILNIVFYCLLLLPVIFQLVFGYFRGFKKTAWKLVIYAIYMTVFFITINSVSEKIFTSDLFASLASKLEEMITGVSNTTTKTFCDFSHSLMKYLLETVGEGIDTSSLTESVYVVSLFEGLVLYAIKVIWSIIYLIIIVPIFCILTRLLIFNIFFKGKKEFKKLTRDPFLGVVTGSLYGLLKAFVLMIYFGGFISLIAYTGEITNITEQISNSGEVSEAKEENSNDPIKLSNNYEVEELGLTDSVSDIANTIETVVDAIKVVNETWNNNFLVKMANNIYYEEEVTVTNDDGEEEVTKQKVEILDKCFDELVYFKYDVSLSEDLIESGRNELSIKVNFIEDINSIVQMILYILDDDELFQERSDGSTQINLANLDSARVETAFNFLSQNNIMKVMLVVGINILINNTADSITAVDLTDPNFQNQLYNTDFTEDLSTLGTFVGGLIDLGLGKFLSDFMNDKVDKSNYISYLNIFNPEQNENESDADYNARVLKARNKVVDSVENFNIIKLGSSLVSTYLIENLLKDKVESLGLNEADLNAVEGTTEYKSYKENLINSIKLDQDMGLIFEIIFDLADFEKDGKLEDLIDKFTNKEETESSSTVTNDEVASFANLILADLSEISFLQAAADIGVKIALTKIDNESIKKHLTLNNIFSSYIDWKDQLGEKIPNLVTAIVTNDVLDIFLGGNDIASEIFELDSFEGVFKDSIEALFELQLISNLEDTALTPLLQDLIGSMAGDSLTIKVSDDLGKEGHKYKDEILSFISIFDDLLEGAKANGCTSFDTLFSDLTNVIKGIGNVDSKKLADSAILGPTMAYFLSTMDNETLVCPYIYEDSSWYSTNETKGELENLVDAIKGVVDNDAVISLISGETVKDENGNEKSTLDLITEFGDKELESLFKSAIIKATVTNLLSTFSSDSFKIVIPSTAKEEITISNYKEEDVTKGNVVLTSDTITKEDGTNVYKAKAKYLSENEFNSVVRAIKQIGNLEDLMSGTLDLSIVKNFKGDAVDGETHDSLDPDDKYADWCYTDEEKTTRKSKIDVIFESEVLRCTLSYFFTGDNYESEYFVFPKDEMEFIDDFYYVKHDSICSLFNSVLALLDNADISDLTNISSSLVNDILTIDSSTLDEMFESKILAATLSNVIMKVDSLAIPLVTGYIDAEECFPMVDTTTYSTKYIISGEEFKALFKSISICFPDSFNLDADFDVNEILGNLLELGYLYGKGFTSRIDAFYSSKIFEATLAKYITNVGALKVPEDAVTGYTRIAYDSTTETYSLVDSYKLTENEERYLLRSLEKLFPYKNGGLTGDIANIDYTSLIGNIITLSKAELTQLFSSSILNATISDTLMGVSAIVVIKDTVTKVKYLNNGSLTDTEDLIVIKSADTAGLIYSLSFIFGDNVDINNIGSDIINDILKLNEEGLTELFSSKILSATISKTLLEQEAIVVPHKVYNTETSQYDSICSSSLKVTKNGDAIEEADITLIDQTHLVKLLSALDKLFNGSVDFDSIGIDTFKNLSRLSDEDLNTLTDSVILNATISDKLTSAFGEGSSTKIIIPSTETLAYSMSDDDTIYMVKSSEIKSLIKAMGYFDFDSFGSGDQFATFKELVKDSGEYIDVNDHSKGYKSQISVILESKILHATMSNILLSMSTGGSLSLLMPSTIKEETEAYEIVNKKVSDTEKITFIKTTEIENMLNAISYLDINSFGGGSDIFNTLKELLDPISLIESDRKIDIILESDILRATISNYLFDLDTGSIKILVPNDTTNVLDTECDNLVKESKQAKIRMIKIDELTSFIEGVSSLDLDALGGSDIGNTVKSLSNTSSIDNNKSNIEMINDSYILQVSFSNFLIENIGSMGFSGMAIPASALEVIEVIELKTVSENKEFIANSEYYTLVNDSSEKELVNFVNSMQYLDLNSIASDTLNAIASLNKVVNDKGTSDESDDITKLDMLFDSKIMKYTLSAQILDFSGINTSTWKFIIPNQAIENGGNILNTSETVFANKLNTKTQNLIKEQDIKDLINALGVVDLTSVSAEMLMSIEESKFSELVDSRIFLANASSKFKEALGSNTTKIGTSPNERTIGSFATASQLYDSSLDYNTVPNDSSNKTNVILKQELCDIYNSMKIMGTSSLGSFNIGLDTLGNFADDNDTTNDDNRTYDSGDSRAKFLRSLFIRSLISYILGDENTKEVSEITIYMENLYGDTYTLKALDSSNNDQLSLTLSNTGVLSWTAATLRDSSNVEYNCAYSGNPSIIYTVTINGEAQTSQTTTSLDISSKITNYNFYTISVKAEIDGSNLTDAAYLAFTATNSGLSKPLRYTNLANIYKMNGAALVSGTVENLSVVNHSSTTITDYVLSNNKIIFNKVENATDYVVTIYDYTDDSVIKTFEINSTNATNEVDLKGQLSAGKYYYTIKAKSNVTYNNGSNNVAMYNDSITTNSAEFRITEELTSLKAEIIGHTLYIKKNSNAINGVNVKVGGTNFDFSYSSGNYIVDLSSKTLNSGINTIEIIPTVDADLYTIANTTINFNNINNISSVALSLDETNGDNIVINRVSEATKYIVEINRIEAGEEHLQLYKEIVLDSTSDPIKLSASNLFKGYEYEVNVTPIDTENAYVSNTFTTNIKYAKALDSVTTIKVSEDLTLNITEVDNATSYKVIVYTKNSDDTYTEVERKTYVNNMVLSDEFTLDDSTKYYLAIVAKSESELYTDSAESVKKSFQINEMDRVFDLSYEKSSNTLSFTDLDQGTASNEYTYKVVAKVKDESGNFVDFENNSVIISTYTTDEKDIVSINVDDLTSINFEDSKTYKLFVYTEASDDCYKESKASIGVKYSK